MSIVVIDSNLLVLLIVGAADRRLIASHKRLGAYEEGDYELLQEIIASFGDIAVPPNVMTEVFNLARQIEGPALGAILRSYAAFATGALEFYIPSLSAAGRTEFSFLGLTDTVLLQLCLEQIGLAPTLLTADERLAAQARALEQRVINFPEAKRTGIIGAS